MIALGDVERAWPDFLSQLKAKRMSIGVFLSESQLLEVIENRVVFGFPEEFKFHKETVEQQNNKIFVRDILAGILGTNVDVSFVVTQPEHVEQKAPVESVPSADSGVITSALEIFDGSKVIRKT